MKEEKCNFLCCMPVSKNDGYRVWFVGESFFWTGNSVGEIEFYLLSGYGLGASEEL